MAKKVKTHADEAAIPVAQIDAPYIDVGPAAYRPMHINLHLSGEQREALKRLTMALQVKQEKCLNERNVARVVVNHHDAVRWLMDQLVTKFT